MILAPEHAEELSWLPGLDGPAPADFLFKLDLFGYAIDPESVLSAQRQAREVRNMRQRTTGVLPRFRALMLRDGDLGQILGIPRSTIQAIAAGRLAERYTPAQRAALRELVNYTLSECQKALDALA